MKKGLMFLSFALVGIFGLNGVKAEEPPIKFNRDSINCIQQDTKSEFTFYFKENSVPADYVNDSWEVHYKLDGGEEKTNGNYNSIVLKGDQISALLNQPEHTIEVWLEKNGEKSDHDTLKFLIVNGNSERLSSNGASVTIDGLPIGTTFSFTKVTDKTILNKFGSSYVYNAKFTSNGKDLSYYEEKYGRYVSTYGTLGANISNISIPVPSNLVHYTYTSSDYIGLYNNNFELIEKELNASGTSITPILRSSEDNISLYDGGYVVFKITTKTATSTVSSNSVKNPNTSDNILIIGASAILLIGVTLICTKKYKTLKNK